MTHPQIQYRWESLAELLDDGEDALTLKHWREIAVHQAEVPLDVNWESLLRKEALGTFKVFGARRLLLTHQPLIGYSSWVLYHPERYQSTLYVMDDVFWLAPEERHGMTGYYLIAKALASLPKPFKLQMRRKISYANARGRSQDLIFKRLGLEPVEMVYGGYFPGDAR